MRSRKRCRRKRGRQRIDAADVLFDGQDLAAAWVGSFESGTTFTRNDLAGSMAAGYQFELRAMNPSGVSGDCGNELLTQFVLWVR